MIMRGTIRTVVNRSTLPFSFRSQRRRFIRLPSRWLAGKSNGLDVLPGNVHAALWRHSAEYGRSEVHVVAVDAAAVGEQSARGISEMRRRDIGRKRPVGNRHPLEGQVLDRLERNAVLN